MTRPCVLVFSGADPSGGAGMQADVQAIAAQGAHALSVITALTAQDNNRVQAVQPVEAAFVRQQAQVLIDRIDIAAIKIGIAGNRANAAVIADLIRQLKTRKPGLPVVLDPVLASGHGDALAADDAMQAVALMMPVATLLTPNLPEAARLCGKGTVAEQAERLLETCPNVLIKGGHGEDDEVVNAWFARDVRHTWRWPRLPGAFHGTGCTLASAIAALLAQGIPMETALGNAQAFCHRALESAYAIADGQMIPNRQV